MVRLVIVPACANAVSKVVIGPLVKVARQPDGGELQHVVHHAVAAAAAVGLAAAVLREVEARGGAQGGHGDALERLQQLLAHLQRAREVGAELPPPLRVRRPRVVGQEDRAAEEEDGEDAERGEREPRRHRARAQRVQLAEHFFFLLRCR